MLVEELMSTDVVTVRETATLREAVDQLLAHDVGSVVAVSDAGHPVGIVTETDILRAVHRTGQPLADLDVAELSHRAVVTTAPSATVRHVSERMAEKGVKKVPVMDDLELVGIITLTDIVWHLSDIRKEATSLADARERWDPHD